MRRWSLGRLSNSGEGDGILGIGRGGGRLAVAVATRILHYRSTLSSTQQLPLIRNSTGWMRFPGGRGALKLGPRAGDWYHRGRSVQACWYPEQRLDDRRRWLCRREYSTLAGFGARSTRVGEPAADGVVSREDAVATWTSTFQAQGVERSCHQRLGTAKRGSGVGEALCAAGDVQLAARGSRGVRCDPYSSGRAALRVGLCGVNYAPGSVGLGGLR